MTIADLWLVLAGPPLNTRLRWWAVMVKNRGETQ